MARSKVTLKLIPNGFAEIRTAPKVMAAVNEAAYGIAADAQAQSDGEFIVHEAEVTGGRVRGRAAVVTGDYDAIRDQARDHVLEKAIGGGPGA